MAVKLSPIGNDAPYVDSNGSPFNGALLYTYVAGSVTAAPTYTTSTGNVQNDNPMTLNSAGYPTTSATQTQIWLTAGVSYLFVLKTSAGVTVWSRDNIAGINDTTTLIDQWISGPTPTYVSGTSFTLVGDQTAAFHAGRRIKTTNTSGSVYSSISTSVFGAVTTVTVVNDSGTLDSGLSAVSYSILSATNPSTPSPILTDAGSTSAPAVSTHTDTNTGFYYPSADQIGIVVGGVEVARSKSAGSSFFRRNRLKNASFAVDQRVNSATSRADDVYGIDCWYTLTQTAAIQVTQSALQENGQPYNIRLTQNQAAAQRMGVAQIIEARDSQADRGRTMSLSARVRISNSQAIRYAILEWTGTADSVTSDVVNDWTSGTYTAGNFFLAANLTVTAVGSMTPSANTWTQLTTLNGTAGSSLNNWVVLIWTEGTAAQNLTLDVGLVQLEHGSVATEFEYQDYEHCLRDCLRYLWIVKDEASGNHVITSGFSISTTVSHFPYRFAERMRVAPTISTTDVTGYAVTDGAGTGIATTGLTFSNQSPTDALFVSTVAGALTAGQGSYLYVQNSNAAIMTGTAEL